MPRPTRIDWPGARHHVMNRGARRAPVFTNDNQCAQFLALLAQLPERFGLAVHGYALMPNHFHLMLESERGDLSRGMAFLQARYSLFVNRRHGWDGPLFRARFRSKVVDRLEHWRHLLVYLHLNPLRAHLVMNLAQVRWTSHRAYLGRAPHLDWVTTEEILGELGGLENYRLYLRECRNQKEPVPDDFERRALFDAGRRRPIVAARSPVKRHKPGARSLDEELARAAQLLNAEIPDLVAVRAGRAADPRRRALVWWLVQRRGIASKEVARMLGVSQVRISQLVKQGQCRPPGSALDLASAKLLDESANS